MKLQSILIIVIGFVILSLGSVLAVLYLPNGLIIEQSSNGYATPQSNNKDITLADASCRKITSTSNTQYFIPTRTNLEAISFISNPPSGVNIASCAPTSGVCGTFQCTSIRQGNGYNIACWNRFSDQIYSWTSSGYLTPVQRDQVIADGQIAWANSCAMLPQAISTLGSYDREAILNSSPVTGAFILGTEEYANFGGCTVDAQVQCPSSNTCSSILPTCNGTSCSLTIGAPTSANQLWVKGATNCGFTCMNGYTGNDCLTPPSGGPSCMVTFISEWIPDFEELAVGQTGNAHMTSVSNPSKFSASCAAYDGARCTDIDPSSTTARFACFLPCKDSIVEYTNDICVGYPYGNAELWEVRQFSSPTSREWWQSNVPSQGPLIYNSCTGRPVSYHPQSEINALPNCDTTLHCSPINSHYLWNGLNWDDYGNPNWTVSGVEPTPQIIAAPQTLPNGVVLSASSYPGRVNRLRCSP